MSSGSDKVQAGMYTKVYFVDTARLLLLQHIGFMLIVQELNDWHPGVAVVDIVSKARGINNSQSNCRSVNKTESTCRFMFSTLEELFL